MSEGWHNRVDARSSKEQGQPGKGAAFALGFFLCGLLPEGLPTVGMGPLFPGSALTDLPNRHISHLIPCPVKLSVEINHQSPSHRTVVRNLTALMRACAPLGSSVSCLRGRRAASGSVFCAVRALAPGSMVPGSQRAQLNLP